MLEDRSGVECLWVAHDHRHDDVLLTRSPTGGRDAVDVDVAYVGMLEDDPADEALGDELPELAEPALLLAVAEEVPAVLVTPAHVAGVHPSAADLAGRRLGVLEVLQYRVAPGGPRDELTQLSRRHGVAVLVDDVQRDELL